MALKHRTVRVPFDYGDSTDYLVRKAQQAANVEHSEYRAHEVLDTNSKSAKIVVWYES